MFVLTLVMKLIRPKKQSTIGMFIVSKLMTYQKQRKNSLLLLIFTTLVIIYTAYIQTFTLIVILAWFGVLVSMNIITNAQIHISRMSKSKNAFKNNLLLAKSTTILEIAKELEYNYSDIKIGINYLMEKGEIPNRNYII